MTRKNLWRAVLIVVLSVVLATPVKANGFPSAAGIIAGAVAAGAAVVIVIVVVVHEASKTTRITGCVKSGESGMSLMDETDKRTYMLSGNTLDVKPDCPPVIRLIESWPARTSELWDLAVEA